MNLSVQMYTVLYIHAYFERMYMTPPTLSCFHCRTAVMAGLWSTGLLVVNFIIPCALGTESTTETSNNLVDFWIVRLAINLLGYATVFVPGAIIINYLRKIKFNETGGVFDYRVSYQPIMVDVLDH